ncbi:uncharacterized protein LOC106012799 [Aplysia californica]|uniref:Uncharacterized protein LOC106012799 n=1 Tax=Aplysia californica TaxID=6500 RepID=A0ABM1A7C8_APLCA|nr:uncharacterized protein LOC106012799 [Aplysia californica]
MFRRLSSDFHTRQNWKEELRHTNDVIMESLEVARSLRQLCRHGRAVTRVTTGSVLLRMRCPRLISVLDLCRLQTSGELQTLMMSLFGGKLSSARGGLFTFSVRLDMATVKNCQDFLVGKLEKNTVSESGGRKRSPVKKSPMKRAVRSSENLLVSPSSPVSPLYPQRCWSNPAIPCHSPLAGVTSVQSPTLLSPRRERNSSVSDGLRCALQELNLTDEDSPQYHRLTLSHGGKDGGQQTAAGRMTSPRLKTPPNASPLTSPRWPSRCDVIREQENS